MKKNVIGRLIVREEQVVEDENIRINQYDKYDNLIRCKLYGIYEDTRNEYNQENQLIHQVKDFGRIDDGEWYTESYNVYIDPIINQKTLKAYGDKIIAIYNDDILEYAKIFDHEFWYNSNGKLIKFKECFDERTAMLYDYDDEGHLIYMESPSLNISAYRDYTNNNMVIEPFTYNETLTEFVYSRISDGAVLNLDDIGTILYSFRGHFQDMLPIAWDPESINIY